MLQSLVDADAFGRVQHQGAVQQVLQLHHLLPLVLGQALAPDHVGQQIFGGVDGAHNRHLFLKTQESKPVLVSEKPTFFSGGELLEGTIQKTYSLRYFVHFDVQEVEILIEVLVFEQTFTDHLRKEKQQGCIRRDFIKAAALGFIPEITTRKEVKFNDEIEPCWAFCP